MSRPTDDRTWRITALDKLTAPGPAEPVLRELITWLDMTVHWEPASSRQQTLVRMHLAAGRALLDHHGWDGGHRVAATIRAAAAYVRDPTEDNHKQYFLGASRSYPFGSGEGCYAMPGSVDCSPGTGCRTGAGSLAEVASSLGAETVLRVLRAEVAPHLRIDRG